MNEYKFTYEDDSTAVVIADTLVHALASVMATAEVEPVMCLLVQKAVTVVPVV